MFAKYSLLVGFNFSDIIGHDKEQRNILHEISKPKDNRLVTFCVETAYNRLLKDKRRDRHERKTRKKT
jgi:hypothetical protein